MIEMAAWWIHLITLHFWCHTILMVGCRPILSMDGEIHNGNQVMSPYMYIGTANIYLGGVPDATMLDAQLPVYRSIVGGINNLAVNAQ